MNDFWDDLIERKYSNRSKFFDLHISDLTKFKSGNYNQYFGYEYNSDYMVNVCFYIENSEVFLGLGRGLTEYEADNFIKMRLQIKEDLNDKLILKILKNNYRWKIDNFFDLCS